MQTRTAPLGKAQDNSSKNDAQAPSPACLEWASFSGRASSAAIRSWMRLRCVLCRRIARFEFVRRARLS